MTEQKTTESRNHRTMNLDSMSTGEILRVMNEEDKTVPDAVNEELSQIEKAARAVIDSFNKGGKLVYVGAGTSGRLGVLDAAECPPTFGTDSGKVQALIAGGETAMTESIEGAEDDPEQARADLREIELNENDTVIALAASGQTPYCIGGLEYSNAVGATTAAISCNKNSKISEYADIPIEIEVGPEVLTGSTRLKAGTAQKMTLNMISTSSMIGIGKAYQNLMVDVQPTNEKLKKRAKGIVARAAETDEKTASIYLERARHQPKIAIIMLKLNCSYEEAKKHLTESNGFVQEAIKLVDKESAGFE